MKAYEYIAEVLSDGHLSIPQDLSDIPKPDTKVRVVLLITSKRPALIKSLTRAIDFCMGLANMPKELILIGAIGFHPIAKCIFGGNYEKTRGRLHTEHDAR